jgi:DNA-directed RNA polymerase specialized sigma24 family protein
MRFYAAWAFVVITLTWGRKGVRKMMNSEQYREHIERTFNGFCKIVLYHAALGAYKKLRKKQQFEVSLDYLREFDFEPVATTDECFVKYDVPTTFTICGKTVIVENEHLAAALFRLPEKRREVLFLWYYLGYSDAEISKMCGISRSAVFRRRKIALRFMRKEMEALENEE